jgi:hypothetical protein
MALVNELSAVPLTVTEPSHALTPRKSLSLCAAAGMQKQKTAKNIVLPSIVLNIPWRYSAPVRRQKQDKCLLSAENLNSCRYSQQLRSPAPPSRAFGRMRQEKL